MLALVNTPGGPEPLSLRTVAEPVSASEEALVRVEAVSVNRGELALMAARAEGWRPGQDIAGVVERAAADGSGPPVGTRVAGLVEGAGWSELVAAPTDRLAAVPESLDIAAAAGLPLVGITALRTLRYGGDLLGRRVLVTGASGAVGRLQVELANRHGARVTAIAAERYAADLRAAGAEVVAPTIEAATAPFDFVTESVGGSSLASAVGATAPGATIVVFGASTGEKTPISLYDFIGHENLTIRVFLSYASPQPFGPDLQLLADLAGRELLHPHVAMTVPWTEFDKGLQALRERRTGGKLILTVA
ncbi:MAG TPA: zinc-binding dehydrogenase [Jatrophihabitantaceae bacterium]|jgi:NADPH:quinone reductase-like Zn-dependent oxidoreductase